MNAVNYKAIVISFLATMVRYYDYGLFGMSAAILSKNYFPVAVSEDRMLGFFAAFSVAVVLRPLGSIIFGKIGDKVGRIVSVKIAIILAAVSTMSIGFIPSSDVIGIWAVLLLTIARIVFLVSLAGEIDAIKIYIAEMVGKKRRNFASSLVVFSAQLGVLIAAAAYHFSQTAEVSEYFWRFNFIGGGVFGILVFILRNSLIESEVFLKAKNRPDIFDNLNLFQIVKLHKVKFLMATTLYGMLGGIYHFLIIFLATFTGNVTEFVSSDNASLNNINLIAIYGFASIVSGVVADRVDYYTQTISGLLIGLGLTILMIIIAASNEIYSLQIHKILVFVMPFIMVPTYIKIQSLFSTKVRMRLCSLSHSLGSMIFSSTTPLFCLLLWKLWNLYFIVLSYFAIQLLILLMVVFFFKQQDFTNEFEN